MEHCVQDGRQGRRGDALTISKRLQFVEVGPDGAYRQAGAAPYLDYRAASDAERGMLDAELDADWLKRDWEQEVMGYAIAHVIPAHLDEVKTRRR